ncbi:MAG: efflux RND transporter periplasmic adaptor subunit [Cruoricaptor ignavus]|nr:efflux RND transporter periplasmic adaptor subunit [Cruoricaptor ignavus]
MKNNLVILSLAAMSFVACKKENAPMQNSAKPYSVVDVAVENVVGHTEYPASIEGKINNDVRAKIQGYITQVLVDEGQFVTKGQPLFRIETNVLNENADAAKAGISASQATISAAQASVNAAQIEVNKLKPLVAKNIISKVQLETANANLLQAQAQLKQAQAAHQQSQANYKSVVANIDYSIVRAPISGVVGRIPLKVGSLVSATDATPLTVISDTNSVYAYFSLNEKDYFDFLKNAYGATVPEKIKNLPMVQLKLANGSFYGEKGRIETVTGQIDPNTGTVQFRVEFPNPQRLLSNGNSGTIVFPKNYDNATVIPEVGTTEQQGLVYAYKVQADSVVSTTIQVEDRFDNMVVVKEGLKKGDVIVVSGLDGLRTGTKIIPKKVKFDSLVQSIKPIF